MAKLKFTKNGIYVVDLSIEECIKLGYGFVANGQYYLLCDSCNEVINKRKDSIIHFVPVLGDTFCDECMKDIENNDNYAEDLDYQNEVYENIIARNLIEGLDHVDMKWYNETFKDKFK